MKKISEIFSPKEIVVTVVTVLISGVLVSSILWGNNPGSGSSSGNDQGKYIGIGSDIVVKTATGGDVSPFHTTYYVIYDKTRSDTEKAQVLDVLEENIPHLHKICDRDELYYVDDNDTSLGYMTTVKTVNESYGSVDFVEVDKDLYNVLSIGKQMTIMTNSAYNMFVGELSDYWNSLLEDENYQADYQTMDPDWSPAGKAKVTRLQSVLPLSEADVNAILELKNEDGKYYVRFNKFKDAVAGEISITLGGIAKGYANDVISEKLTDLGLVYGAIYGGGSSITTLGDRYGDSQWETVIESPTYQAQSSFTVRRDGVYGMSTSGGYLGTWIPADSDGNGVADSWVLRHHIIDARTGYPAKEQMMVNIISGDLSGTILDCLSTAFVCLTEKDGYALRQQIVALYGELNIALINSIGLDYNSPSITGYIQVDYTLGYSPYFTRTSGVKYYMLS